MTRAFQGALRALAGGAGIAVALTATPVAGQPARLLAPTGSPAREVPALGVRSMATPIVLNRAKALSGRPGDTLEITLPNASRNEYVLDVLHRHGEGMHSWVGYHKAYGTAHRAIITTGPGGSFGVVSTPQGEFRIVPGDGHDWLVDMGAEGAITGDAVLKDDERLPPVAPKRAGPVGTPSTALAFPGVSVPSTRLVAPTPQATVDILFAYTRGLALRLGGNLMTRLNFLVTRANTAYADSEIAITLRLVSAAMVEYPDSGDTGDALGALTPGCAAPTPLSCDAPYDIATFGAIDSLRVASGADLVALLRNGGSFSGNGVAWLGGASPSANFTHSATTGCVLGCESVFIHEVGHNMGSRHDRATVAWQAGGTASYSGTAGFAFGYAFCESGILSCNPEIPPGTVVSPGALAACSASQQPECSTGNGSGGTGTNNFADLMSYFDGSTLTNYKFANPSVTCAGRTGIAQPCGTAASNAALAINNNRLALSAVKTAVVADPPPGFAQFTATNFGALEASGTISVTVSRLGGTGGTLTASYATSDGTARAGQDYTASNGVVTWPNGDGANKTIIIPLVNDGANEDGKFFRVTLSNPTGAAGAFLGYPNTADAVIVDTWPLNNTIPAGFNPAAGTGAWTLANDISYEGPFLMRSAQAFNGASSDMTYTGTFREGPVGFAYQVSSYPNFGFFEFAVDGVTVLSESGESGWKYFTYTLTPGTHTLRWRYRGQLSFLCRDAINPEAPGGDNCADRAWIDAVVLPVASASSALSDVNGDGKSDVVYRNNASGQVFRLLANGTTLSGGTMAYTEPNTQWRVIADGDFNGDGVSDLLWRNSASGHVYQMPFTTAGLPGAGAVIYTEPNPSWKIIHTPDLNGDGKADLLWWNSSTGQVFGVLLNGGAVIGSGMIYTEPNTAWKIVAVGDFSGSGKKNQLLYRNESSGLVYMMTVSFAGGAFSQVGQVIYSEPNTAWAISGAADLNGDGKSDILYRNGATGQVFGLLMNGGAVSGSGQLHVEPNTAWKVVSFGDYNGDGRADLLWRNDATGQVYMMLTGATGLAIQSQGMVYTEPNTAWKVLGPYEYAQ